MCKNNLECITNQSKIITYKTFKKYNLDKQKNIYAINSYFKFSNNTPHKIALKKILKEEYIELFNKVLNKLFAKYSPPGVSLHGLYIIFYDKVNEAITLYTNKTGDTDLELLTVDKLLDFITFDDSENKLILIVINDEKYDSLSPYEKTQYLKTQSYNSLNKELQQKISREKYFQIYDHHFNKLQIYGWSLNESLFSIQLACTCNGIIDDISETSTVEQISKRIIFDNSYGLYTEAVLGGYKKYNSRKSRKQNRKQNRKTRRGRN